MIITTSSALADFCSQLRSAPYIAVDTEFLRDRTYYSQLCLIQIAHGEHAAAVDILVSDLDLAPLRELLFDPDIIKVFHSASQDLAIFLHRFGQVPGPVFDTQLAASVCGLGEQIGYASLVANLLGVEIDKSFQATDWTRRPLSSKQIDYALGDVTHLCTVYERLLSDLRRCKRFDWVKDDMEALLDPLQYELPPNQAWRRIRVRRSKARTLVVLRELAAWREQTARHRNIPRSWVLRDDAMIEISEHHPKTVKALAQVRHLKLATARGRDGRAILEAVSRALALPRDQWPKPPVHRTPSSEQQQLVALLQTLLRLCCDQHNVAIRMVASRADLDRLVADQAPDIPALRGWRREVFGRMALDLCRGRLALGVRNGRVEIIPLDSDDPAA